MARQVLENGVVLPAEYSDDWYDDMTSNLTKLDDVIGSDSEKLSSSDVGAAALSNNYNDLDNLPTIPTVNDATLTIQKNGVDVQTFTANASSNVTANITVPTKTSDITNDSNFVDTSNPAVSSGITSSKVTDYDAHIADTDIHVTTADKSRWNNQTYVFRYSSTALVASSTNANSLLDNTDNLKVGDKVIDSSGVLFSITAIDTQNSTFTIGTALIDLAQDSDVVHKSGDETIGGTKTFSNVIPINGAYLGDEPSTSFRTVLLLRSRYDTAGKSGWLVSKFRSNSAQGALSGSDTVFLNFDVLENEVRTNGILRFNLSSWSGNTPGRFSLIPSSAIDSYLGTSGSKWSAINGLEPSALGMPDLNNGIDISSYLTNAGTVTPSEYTPSVNGYICVQISADSPPVIRMYNDYGFDNTVYTERNEIGSTSGGTYTRFASLIFPANKDVKVYIIIMPSTFGIISAKFFPCQGNV